MEARMSATRSFIGRHLAAACATLALAGCGGDGAGGGGGNPTPPPVISRSDAHRFLTACLAV